MWADIVGILQIEMYSSESTTLGGINSSDLKGSTVYVSWYIATINNYTILIPRYHMVSGYIVCFMYTKP